MKSIQVVLLAAVLSCLPAAPAFGAQAEPAGSVGAVRFGFRANFFDQKRTLKLFLSGADCHVPGNWSMRADWKEKERQLDLVVDFGEPVRSHMPQIGHCEADVSRVFPVGESGVMTPGEISATFRSGERVVGTFRMTVTEREIAVEQVEPRKGAVVSSRARRYLVVPRTGTVLLLIDPFQSKETVDGIGRQLQERGYRELEMPGGFDPHVLAPSWLWHRGTVPMYCNHRRYFEPKDGTKLLMIEDWERLFPESVSVSIAAWP